MDLRTVDLDGSVSYADFGGAGTPVVLVHGLGGSYVNWGGVAPALAGRARVLAVELVGSGRTAPLGRSASCEANAAMLGRFVEAVAGGPAVLVGNSLGGLVSILAAARFPDRVSGLVLVDPAIPGADGSPHDPMVEQIFAMYDAPGVGEQFLDQFLRAMEPRAFMEQFFTMICADRSKLPEELFEAEVREFAEGLSRPWAEAAFLEAARSMLQIIWHHQERFWAELEGVKAPTLLVEGARDRLVLRSATDALAARRPEWTYRVIEGVGHAPMMEDPQGFLALALRWLERQGLLSPAGSPVPS